MVYAEVSEAYIHFTIIYTTDQLFRVIPIKYLINEDGNTTTPVKLETGTKPSVSHSRVLFCPRVVRKATAHFETKALNMCYQSQKSFRGIFDGIPHHQKGYILYLPSTRKIISSYHVVFDENFSSALAYTSQPYLEAMAMCLAVTYTPCAMSSREQTGNKITFAQFEEGNILAKTRNGAESGEKYDDNSIMPPLLSKEDMYDMDFGNE